MVCLIHIRNVQYMQYVHTAHVLMCVCVCFERVFQMKMAVFTLSCAGTVSGAEKLEKFLTYTQSDLYGNLM